MGPVNDFNKNKDNIFNTDQQQQQKNELSIKQ
jgi:hypothetical protein